MSKKIAFFILFFYVGLTYSCSKPIINYDIDGDWGLVREEGWYKVDGEDKESYCMDYNPSEPTHVGSKYNPLGSDRVISIGSFEEDNASYWAFLYWSAGYYEKYADYEVKLYGNSFRDANGLEYVISVDGDNLTLRCSGERVVLPLNGHVLSHYDESVVRLRYYHCEIYKRINRGFLNQ